MILQGFESGKPNESSRRSHRLKIMSHYQPFHYVVEEHDFTQGHTDPVQTVDLLPKDKKHFDEMDDDSVTLLDWLEWTGKLYPVFEISYGKGTWKCFSVGDLKTHDSQFCGSVDSNFKNIHGEHPWAQRCSKPDSSSNLFRPWMRNQASLPW